LDRPSTAPQPRVLLASAPEPGWEGLSCSNTTLFRCFQRCQEISSQSCRSVWQGSLTGGSVPEARDGNARHVHVQCCPDLLSKGASHDDVITIFDRGSTKFIACIVNNALHQQIRSALHTPLDKEPGKELHACVVISRVGKVGQQKEQIRAWSVQRL
jgi:hypothetical protein